MSKLIKRNSPVIFAILLSSLLALSSCQEEITELIIPNGDSVVVKNSNLANLIGRVTQNDGSEDDYLDSARCFNVKFPFTVLVNGTEWSIASIDDLEHLKDELDDTPDDDDIDFIYPITVIFADHSEITVPDEDTFEDLLDDCEYDDDDYVECIDFQYPLSISVYDAQNQLASVLTFRSDAELYKFVENLDDDDLASFKFPIYVTIGEEERLIRISSNDDLEDIIEDAFDCEVDDDDYDDGDDDDHNTHAAFDSLLVGETWKITYFYDDSDRTPFYQAITFSFQENGLIIAQIGALVYSGQWDVDDDEEGNIKLDIDFDDPDLLVELDNDWEVYEWNENRIRMAESRDDLNDDDNDFLTLEKL